MQKQQKLILIAGIGFFLIAAVLITSHIEQERQKAIRSAKKEFEAMKANQVSVLVAAKDISRGTNIEADSVEAKILPNQYVEPRAVTSIDRIAGMTAAVDISKGEQLTLGKLAAGSEKSAGGSLAMATPVGKRAVSVAIDNIASVGGMVKPGDYVDVISVVPIPVITPDGKQELQATTMPLFQNVLVLAVGMDLISSPAQAGSRYAPPKETGNSGTITVSLSPQEANFLAFVIEQQAKIRLILRSPADSKIEMISPANWETLFRYVLPQAGISDQEAAPKKAVPAAEVEIYRGLQREIIPLTGAQAKSK